ncbi:MobF family relaxase [Spirillospora sp. NPDC050679]
MAIRGVVQQGAGRVREGAAVAWLTVIGPAMAQVDYRLEESAGCAADPAPDHDHEHAQVDYRMDSGAVARLVWFGGGLAEVGITAGTALRGEDDKAAARALMDGCDPRTGQQLVDPKRASHPASRLPAAPLLAALQEAASGLGVEVAELPRTVWSRKRLERMVRQAGRHRGLNEHREGVGEDGRLGGHRVRVADLERLVRELRGDAAVRLEDIYEPAVLAEARAHRGHTVRVGDRGFDLTLDIPKSPSIVWALGDETTAGLLQDAFRQAVADTMSAVESWCSYGMRGQHGDGKTARRIDTSGFLGWVMFHDVARPVDGAAPDPHLHAHVVIAHMVKGTDGRWSTPGNGGRELHRHVQAAGALVQARFRALTTEQGFRWERVGGGWELAGVPPKVRSVFSKRAGQSTDKLAELALAKGLEVADAPRMMAKAASGMSKQGKTSVPTDLRAAWRDEAGQHGLDETAIEAMVAAARPGDDPPGVKAGGPGGPDGPVTPSLDQIAAAVFDPEHGLTARNKVATMPRVLAAVLDQLPAGIASGAEAEALARQVVAVPGGPALPLRTAGSHPGVRGPAYQTHPERYTSRDIIDAEHTVLDLARRGLHHHDAAADGAGGYEGLAVVGDDVAALAISTFESTAGFALSAEQRAVVERLVQGGHAVDAVVGVAGAGKTTLMAAARSAWNAAGLTVRGATTAAVAAQNLHTEAGIPSGTVARLLKAIEDPKAVGLEGTDVLVIDEAAMVDDRDLARLLTAAHDVGAKVVMVGDPQQLTAIGVGGTFAAVHRLVNGLELTENRRQRDHDERAALARWRTGDRDGALREWAQAGRVHAAPDRTGALQQMLADWATTRTGYADPHDELGAVMVLAGTRADVADLNTGVRRLRRLTGEITGQDKVFNAPGGTLALAVGDHVRVHRNDYRTRAKHAAPEDVDVLNGYRGIVTGFDGGSPVVQWRREAADGPVLEQAAFSAAQIADGHLHYGTAMTVAAAQGQTGDRALVYGLGLDPHALYPAMSRDRHRVDLYLPLRELETDTDRARHGPPTDDAEVLDRAVAAYAATLRGDRADRLITPDLADADLADLTVEELDTEMDVELAELTARAQHRVDQRHAAAQAAMVAAPWPTRPHGDRTDDELAALRAHAQREITLHQAVADHQQIELERAENGHGPAATALTQRRQALQHAAAAAGEAARLEAWITGAHTRKAELHAQIHQTEQQLERNPVALRLRGTSRPELRAHITELTAQADQLRAQIDAAHQQRRQLQEAAVAPYRPDAIQLPHQLRTRVEGELASTYGWRYRGAAAELAHLDQHHDAWRGAALDLDHAAAPSRARQAAHEAVLGEHAAVFSRRNTTRDLSAARALLDTVTGEIGHRAALPSLARDLEHLQRAEHRRQAAAERARQQHQAEQARQHYSRTRGYDPHPYQHGPDYGASGIRM